MPRTNITNTQANVLEQIQNPSDHNSDNTDRSECMNQNQENAVREQFGWGPLHLHDAWRVQRLPVQPMGSVGWRNSNVFLNEPHNTTIVASRFFPWKRSRTFFHQEAELRRLVLTEWQKLETLRTELSLLILDFINILFCNLDSRGVTKTMPVMLYCCSRLFGTILGLFGTIWGLFKIIRDYYGGGPDEFNPPQSCM